MSSSQKITILLLIISLGLNTYLGIKAFSTPEKIDNISIPKNAYPFLSKRIFIENQNDILVNFIPLRTAMRKYVQELPEPIGVYFEYLPSGTSIGVNENLEFQLASLVKIPVVMGIYKQIEEGTLKRSDTLILSKEAIDKRYGTLWQKGEGYQLKVLDAIIYALAESDNTASNLLLLKAPKAIDAVFDSLDIPKDVEEGSLIISPKNYSSIFRSLYLSSYLDHQASNEILEILTQTVFKDKLPAGVPANIEIAHKIGIFDSLKSEKIVYTDCGIIYYPNRPYLLCVAAETSNEKATLYIKNISKMVYDFIKSVN